MTAADTKEPQSLEPCEYYIEEFESGDLPCQYEVCVKIPCEVHMMSPMGFQYEHVAMCATKEDAELIVNALNTRAAPVEPQPAMEMVEKVAEALAPFLYDLDGTDLHIRAAQAALSVIMPDLVKVREALNDMLYLSQDRQKAKEALAALDKMFNVTMK